ncbi:GNAT family N-acetyltransferase [Anoxybacteroides tepidamans]|uniref:GNAT family N-acetyltransferase n=1 Tax=Anoxybacteroides tepidamans TaxID=265948 RepID=UPI000481B281|nr:GNAT family N-acetyltransferase [Anoxybacillus tepidamans]
MTIRLAVKEEAPLIHEVMMAAFAEYREMDVPSSALEETVESIQQVLESGKEQALLYFDGKRPIGMVRFTLDETSLYFFRLSVRPDSRGKGIAKAMLRALEQYAKEHGCYEIRCSVRLSLTKNVRLYESMGYTILEERIVTAVNGSFVKTAEMQKQLSYT